MIKLRLEVLTENSGTLQFDNGVHGWALEIGAQLMLYDFLQGNFDDTQLPGVTSQRRDLVNVMNDTLRRHNIPFVVPNIIVGQEVHHHPDQDIIDLVGVREGPTHAAFVLIGFAGFLLNMTRSVQDVDKAADLKSLARNRIFAIPVMCRGIDIDPAALFNALDATSTEPLALRDFLQRAQIAMGQR